MLSQGFEFRTAGIRGRASSNPARLRNSWTRSKVKRIDLFYQYLQWFVE